MKIQCLIERSGPTTVQYNGARFDFVQNAHGHYVCDVTNPGAVRYFLETFAGKLYQEYAEPVAEVAEDAALPTTTISAEMAAALTGADAPEAANVEDLTEPKSDNAEPVAEVESREAMSARYAAMTTKNELESACFADFGVNLNKQFGVEKLKLQITDLIAKKFEA